MGGGKEDVVEVLDGDEGGEYLVLEDVSSSTERTICQCLSC